MWRSSRKGSGLGATSSSNAPECLAGITAGLADIYKKHVLPLERDYKFSQFYSPNLTDGDFAAKPMILLIGQYSTGKTTFVKHLLEKDYPGLRIGPEPTTDKFVAVCHSDQSTSAGSTYSSEVDLENTPAQVLPGHAAVVDRKLPWSQLESFGPGFLSRFEVVHVKSSVFKGVTLIDTPGVLAGNKQWERGYDFEGVIKWFAERVDLVLLFFDAHKLDISDEFRRCILALKGYESKVCILLNKADSVSAQHLMRVYGALMWSLGKVMTAPEVPRIYIGSFWDQPLQNTESRKLFEAETDDLFNLIYSLAARSAARKIDDFLKRVRLCRTHALLMNHLRKQMPLWGKTAKQRDLMNSLDSIYEELAKENQLPLTDFPPAEELRAKLAETTDIHKFPRLESKKIRDVMEVVKARVSKLTYLIPLEEVRGNQLIEGNCIARDEDPMHTNLSPSVWLRHRQIDSMPRIPISDNESGGEISIDSREILETKVTRKDESVRKLMMFETGEEEFSDVNPPHQSPNRLIVMPRSSLEIGDIDARPVTTTATSEMVSVCSGGGGLLQQKSICPFEDRLESPSSSNSSYLAQLGQNN